MKTCGKPIKTVETHSCSHFSSVSTHTPRWMPSAICCQHVVFYFMCRFTCSRCWKTALTLAQIDERLRAHNTAVVLVGDSHHIEPATRLAGEFNLPFPLMTDDDGILHRRYGICGTDAGCHESILVLVDKHGTVRYRQDGCFSREPLRATELLAAVQSLDDC